MERFEISLDVSHVVGSPAKLSARVVAPDDVKAQPAVVVCYPGGSFTKDFWDVPEDRLPGYSFASHAASRGVVTIVVDHIGMGKSTRPEDGDRLTAAFVAECHATGVLELRARLEAGSLAPTLPGLHDYVLAGFGHSNGGCVLINQQGNHSSFDAVGVFGFSNQYLDVPYIYDLDDEEALTPEELPRRKAEAMLQTIIRGEWGSYLDLNRELLRGLFHADDVPEDVVAVADTMQTLTPRGSSVDASIPASAAPAAARITVPVLLVYGEHDVCPDTHAEPATYPQSNDVSLVVTPKAAHQFNFASHREELWSRCVSWLQGLAAT